MRMMMKDGEDEDTENLFVFIMCLRDCRVLNEDVFD